MRSHYCGELGESLIDHEVELAGWVQRRRDHGGVIFVDLRDSKGLAQVVFDPDTPEIFSTAEALRNEYVIRVVGRVRRRPAGTENSALATGQIEVLGQALDILNPAKPSPFTLDEEDVNEELRLKYRYLDLRRPIMQKRLRMRHSINRALRSYLDTHGFVDLETPMLTKPTPEGARDYLVPSRTHKGRFFALPQSPQIFKQLFMMAGFERYYQIVRCFRDEDLRADRQPDFTQLDIETSFLDEAAIMDIMETMIRTIFAEVLDVALPDPFPRLDYNEALIRYGTDRPDLRNPLELVEVADLVEACDFKVFSTPAQAANGRVAALRLPGGGALTRKEIDDYTAFVSRYGAKGLAYIKVNDADSGRDGLQSPIIKFLSDEALAGILERTNAANGDLIFFGADKAKVVNDALGALRQRLGHDRGLLSDAWRPLWVVDFPMFEWDDKSNRWIFLHHPFTAPRVDAVAELEKKPGEIRSRAYDMVLNGSEIGGGSVRIHRPDMQSAVFRLLGIEAEEAEEKFGFLLEALQYGCPPHGGIAFGLDRLVMLMTGAPNIREVIAFPKTQTAWDPLTDAPATASEAQLRELGIRLRKPVNTDKT